MIWKTFVFSFFLVGVFASEYDFSNTEVLKSAVDKLCAKNNATDHAETTLSAIQTFANCVKGLIDAEQLKKEIEDAKPKGALDEVFKKYCAKTPQLKTCFHNIADASVPCLGTAVSDQIQSSKNGTDQLIDFICYKDGDRIALFISEQGPECIQDKAIAIKQCIETIKASIPNLETVNNFSMADRCRNFDVLTACIVTALEQCSTPTPGNMAESLFRYVRKGSPCHTALPPVTLDTSCMWSDK